MILAPSKKLTFLNLQLWIFSKAFQSPQTGIITKYQNFSLKCYKSFILAGGGGYVKIGVHKWTVPKFSNGWCLGEILGYLKVLHIRKLWCIVLSFKYAMLLLAFFICCPCNNKNAVCATIQLQMLMLYLYYLIQREVKKP